MSNVSISWVATILPGRSLAGVPLGLAAPDLETWLAMYAIDEAKTLYKFEEGPILRLTKCDNRKGEVGYVFYLYDNSVINSNKFGIPALSIMLKCNKVFALKVYDFSFPGEAASAFVYQGSLTSNIRLGSNVAELKKITSLDFDKGEGWFITDEKFGLIEVSGWGVPLEEEPQQLITAICVI
ncbi:hypothetical protein M2426_005065 [Pseudomonas moraviensis]|uniref:hypothetical protein n=1 Tax=Pseudomonas moraviensis TaxID=321662 RepID=UPI003D1D8F57